MHCFLSIRYKFTGNFCVKLMKTPSSNMLVLFFSSSVTYPAMGMSPLLPECYGTTDNPGNVTKSPELV